MSLGVSLRVSLGVSLDVSLGVSLGEIEISLNRIGCSSGAHGGRQTKQNENSVKIR